MRKPLSRVTLCGSTRFREAYEEWNKKLTLEGHVVYSVACFGHGGDELTQEEKCLLDIIHLRKIDNSDEILVLDVDGYVCESTYREILYAEAQGKHVTYLSQIQGKN